MRRLLAALLLVACAPEPALQLPHPLVEALDRATFQGDATLIWQAPAGAPIAIADQVVEGTRSFALVPPAPMVSVLDCVVSGGEPSVSLALARRAEDLDSKQRRRTLEAPWVATEPGGARVYRLTFNTLADERAARLTITTQARVTVRASLRPATSATDLASLGSFRGFRGNTPVFSRRKYLDLGGDVRQSILGAGSTAVGFRVAVPARAVLEGHLGVVAINQFRTRAGFQIDFLADGEARPELLLSEQVERADSGRWRPFLIDLGSLVGRRGTLTLRTSAAADESPLVAWGNPILFANQINRKPSVLVISIDALNRDHTSLAGYRLPTTPFLASLAQQGVYYSSFIPQYGHTYPSLWSMTHSRNIQHDVDSTTEAPVSLMAALRGAGYVTHMFGDLDQFGALAGMVGESHLRLDAPSDPALLERTHRLLARYKDTSSAIWVHLDGPHLETVVDAAHRDLFADNATLPTRYPAAGVETLGQIWRERSPLTTIERARMVLDYDRALRQTDDALRAFFERARRERLLDDTLVIVTTDHGEDLFQHSDLLRGHGLLYDSVTRVPLVWVEPGPGRRGVVDQPVRGIDLAPSILAHLGVPAPRSFEGERFPWPRAAPGLQRFDLSFHLCRSDLVYSLRSAKYKLIHSPSGCRPAYPEGFAYPGQGELYDLDTDPGEQHDLATEQPERAAYLRRQLAERIGALWSDRASRRSTLQKLEEVMRMAGYVR